jgi:putative SOS response-associated peptidase YedK
LEGTGHETVRSFTIITTMRNALCAPVHNRMPVILHPEGYSPWLGETSAVPDALLAMLRPFPAERMIAHKIGPAIGNTRSEGAALIKLVG